MSKLHHTEYKKNYKKYILSTIETGINDEPLKTDEQKIKYIFDRYDGRRKIHNWKFTFTKIRHPFF